MDKITNKKIISTFKRANITEVPLKNLRDLICNKKLNRATNNKLHGLISFIVLCYNIFMSQNK